MGLFDNRLASILNFNTSGDTNTTNEAIPYDKENHKTLNNYPLCVKSGNCPDINVDETIPVEYSPPTKDLTTRTLAVTFESLYKNIASYDYKLDMTNKRYITKIYTLEENKTITVIVDMITKYNIKTTIEGDTGYPYKLVKNIRMYNPDPNLTKPTKVDVTYITEEY